MSGQVSEKAVLFCDEDDNGDYDDYILSRIDGRISALAIAKL